MKEKYIQSLMFWPGEHPCIAYLLDDPIFLNFAVGLGSALGGSTEILQLSDTAAIIYNCEGLLSDLKGNRKVGRKLLAGVFYVVGIEDGELTDLPTEEMEKYFDQFWEPEHYTEADVKEAWKHEFLGGLSDLD